MTGNSNNYAQVSNQAVRFGYSSALRNILTGIFGVSLFIGLTYIGSLIRIPLQPVPITLQTMFVLLAGAVLGARRGSFSQAVYIAIGAFGVPIFAGHAAGLATLGGPTGGYIVAFMVAPILIGGLIRRSQSLLWQAAVFSLGSILILGIGMVHLTLLYTHNPATSLMVGVVPFIPGELFKIAAATSIYRSYTALGRYRTRS